MRHVLQRLNTVPGVVAAAFFAPDGTCITAHATDIVREQSLVELGPLVASALSQDVGRNVASSESAIFRFENGQLVVKRTRNHSLVVQTKPGVDLSTGGVGFHITVAARLLAMHTSRVPPRESATMPAVRDVEAAAPALRAARVPRI